MAVENSDTEYDIESESLKKSRLEQYDMEAARALKDITNRGIEALSFKQHPILKSVLEFKDLEMSTPAKQTTTTPRTVSTGAPSSTTSNTKTNNSTSSSKSRKRKSRESDSDFKTDGSCSDSHALSSGKSRTLPTRKRKRTAVAYRETSDDTDSNLEHEQEEQEEEEEEEQKPFVICATGLLSAQLQKIRELGKMFNVRISEKMSPQVTHIVSGSNSNGIAKRTLKYASAVICGAWIVKFDWVTECLKAKRFVDEHPFEISGDTYALEAPRKGRMAREENTSSLFSGLTFYISGSFKSDKIPPKNELVNLCEWGGATTYTVAPRKNIANQDRTFWIVDSLQTAEELKKVQQVCGVKPVCYTWLLECVSYYGIMDCDKYYAL